MYELEVTDHICKQENENFRDGRLTFSVPLCFALARLLNGSIMAQIKKFC